MIKKLSILVVIIILLIIGFNSLLMPWYVKHAVLVKVPNVIGMNFLEASKVLEDAGLDVKQGDLRYDESKPIGQILDQNPPSDLMVKYGRRIYLIVCGGEQLVEVPKLVGRTMRDAKFSLEQRNLQVGEILKKFSNEYSEDIVISQVIQPGSKVKKSTKIDLIVSFGQQIGDIIIPDLTGKKLEDAKKLLEEKKLKVGKITYQASELTSGQVVEQYPSKDKSAKENTPIDLIVAKKRKLEKPVEEEAGTDNQGNINQSVDKNKPDKPEDKHKEEKPKDKQETTKEKQEKQNDKHKDKQEKPKEVPTKEKTDKPKDKK
jgi:eukaryotic-like serine/threonine-protein kinase